MRALYRGAPTAADLEQAGVTIDDPMCASPNPDGWYYDADDKDWRCILWADNWPAMRLFNQVSTQWRTGLNGPVGLDYNVVYHDLDRLNLDPDSYDDLMGCIRVIEGVALKEMTPKG